MSQENVEIVRREVAARSTRDWHALEEIWHPDIQLEVTSGFEAVTGTAAFTGVREIRPFFESLSDLYAEYRVEVDELIDAGDQVVTVERIRGRGFRGSNATAWVQERLFRVIGFKDGKIWRVKEYRSKADALEAAGLSE